MVAVTSADPLDLLDPGICGRRARIIGLGVSEHIDLGQIGVDGMTNIPGLGMRAARAVNVRRMVAPQHSILSQGMIHIALRDGHAQL